MMKKIYLQQHGYIKIDQRQSPQGFGTDAWTEFEPHPELLPAWAPSIIQLYSVGAERDPYCLYDRFGCLLYQWPENYIPTPVVVASKLRELI
jgi:hypothetical protein